MKTVQKPEVEDLDTNLATSAKSKTPHNLATRYHTVQEVSEILCLSYRSILKAINNGSLQAYRFGKEFRISQEQVEMYLLNSIIDGSNNTSRLDAKKE